MEETWKDIEEYEGLYQVSNLGRVKRFTGTYVLWIASNFVNVVLWFLALQGGYTSTALPMLVMTMLYMVSSVYGKINFRSSNSGKVREFK